MEFLSAGPAQSLWATVLLLGILFISARTGGVLLFALGFRADTFTQKEKGLFSVGAGLILLSGGVLALGLFGLLGKTSLSILVICFAAASLLLRKRSLFELSFPAPIKNWEELTFISLTAGMLTLSWLQALAPPIGMDALSYHLYHAKMFVVHGSVQYVPLTRESLWPYLTEMLFTLGLTLQGTILAQLFHWVFYGLCAWAVYVFAERFFDKRTARFASLIFLFTPAAFAQSGHPYVDLSLAFYVFLGAYPFLLRKDLGDPRAALLSGFFCGGALSTKYLALGSSAILFILWAWSVRGRVKPLFIFLLACGAVAGVWYIRSWVVIGNPVYPFFPHLFGGNGFEVDMMEGVGKGRGLFSFLPLAWNMTMHPYAFGGEMIGPLFLIFAPFLLFGVRSSRPSTRLLAIFTAVYTLFLFTQSQHTRFYLSIATFLSVAAGVGLDRILRSGSVFLRYAAVLIFSGVLLVHSGIFAYRLRNTLGVVSGQERPENYLAARERSFKGYVFLRDHIKEGDRLFNSGEVRYFYGPSSGMTIDGVPLRQELAGQEITIEEFLSHERFEYIWISETAEEAILHFLETNQDYQEVYSYDFTELPYTIHHRIFALQK